MKGLIPVLVLRYLPLPPAALSAFWFLNCALALLLLLKLSFTTLFLSTLASPTVFITL